MRDYLVTIATATLAAWLLQYGGPPARGVVPAPLPSPVGVPC